MKGEPAFWRLAFPPLGSFLCGHPTFPTFYFQRTSFPRPSPSSPPWFLLHMYSAEDFSFRHGGVVTGCTGSHQVEESGSPTSYYAPSSKSLTALRLSFSRVSECELEGFPNIYQPVSALLGFQWQDLVPTLRKLFLLYLLLSTFQLSIWQRIILK